MDFELDKARAAGASDEQIAGALADKAGFDLGKALSAGATHEQVIPFLMERLRPMRDLPEGVTPSDAGAGRGSVMPHGPTLRERLFDPHVKTDLPPVAAPARRGGTRAEGARPFVGGDEPAVPEGQFSVNGHLYKKPNVSSDVFGPDGDTTIRRGVDTIAPSPEPSTLGGAFRALDRKPMDQSLVGSVLENVGDAGRGVAKVLPGLATSLWGGVQAGADVVGADKVAGVAREAAGAGRQYLGQFDNPNGDKLVTGALQSLGTAMLGGAAAGVKGAVGTAVGHTAGDKYAEMRSQGLDVDASLEAATVHGIAEYVGERIGMPSLGRLVSGLAQKTGMKPSEVLKEALKQQGEEQATLAIQDLYDKFGRGSTRNDMTFDDYVNDVVDTAKQTAIMSAVAAGGGRVARAAMPPPAPQERPRVDPPALVDQAINETASSFGLSTRAAVALRDKIKGMSPAKAVQVVAKAFEGFERAGLVKKPGAKDGFLSTLQQQVDEATKEADEQPAQDQAGGTPAEGAWASQPMPAPAPDAGEDFTGLETAPTSAPIEGEPINRNWSRFAPESGTLDIPREQMPQIKAEHRGALVNFLNARGVEHQEEEVDPSSLKPTQAEFSPKKVRQAAEYAGGDRAILVSQDGYVVDGHHQWLAAREAGEPIRVIRLGAPINDLLRLAHQFPSSFTAKGPSRAATGNGSSEPVGTEGAGPAERGAGDGAGGVVPVEQQQPSSAGTAGAAVPDAGVRDAPAQPGPADRNDALTPGQSVTVDGTAYTVMGAGETAVRLQGPDGKTRVISKRSDNWAKIKPAEAAARPSGAGRVIAQVGTTPKTATPLELRANEDGTLTPWHDGHELLDFDSGNPVKVHADASDEDVLASIKAAGSLGRHAKVFKNAEPAAPRESAAATTEGEANGQIEGQREGRRRQEGLLTAPSSEPGAQEGSGVPAPQRNQPARKQAPRATGPKRVMGSDVLGEIVHRLGGIGTALRGDLSRREDRERVNAKTGKKTRYTAWRGDGMLFRKDAPTDLTDIARVLEEAGYLEPGLTDRDYLEATSRVQDIIKAEIDKPGSTQHLGAESVEDQMRRRDEQARRDHEEQQQAALDEFLHGELDMEAAEVSPNDPNRETIAELAQLLDEAGESGVDVEALKEQFFEASDPEWSQQEYETHLTEAIRRATARTGGQAGRDAEGRAGAGDQGRVEAGRDQDGAAGDRADGSDQAVRSEGQAGEQQALTPAATGGALDSLNRTIRGAGWEIGYIDLDLTGEKPKAEIKVMRDDGRWLWAKVDAQGRASFETFQRDKRLGIDPKNRQARLAPQVDDTFLGRQKFSGARAMLRGITQYLADNALNPVSLEDMRKAWAGAMAAPTRKDAPALELQAETEADARAKADREAAALADEKKAKDAEQARLKKESDDREARARADETVDDFQLGQSAEQQLSGQGDLLSAPPAPAEAPPQDPAERWASMPVANRSQMLDDYFGAGMTDAGARYAGRSWDSFNVGERNTLTAAMGGERMNEKHAVDLSDAGRVPEATDILDAETSLWSRITEGKATPDEFKAGFERWVSSKADILAALSKKKKDDLLKMGGSMFAYRYKSDTKPEIVEALWREGAGTYSLGRAVTYSMGKDSYVNALRQMVDATAAEQLAQFVAERKAATEDAVARVSKTIEAIKDPKTLDDFRAFTSHHMREGKTAKEARFMLTPEQRALVDDLWATQTRGSRKASSEVEKTKVRVAGQTVDGDIIATKHTKKGHDLFVVQLAERVSREDYETLSAGAKRIGGYYSSFRGGGAIPGFQFTTRDQAQAFMALAQGDNAAAIEAAKERRDAFQDDRSQTAAERLNEMADRLEERADESLGRERKANTERRARFAANAEAQASADKAMAKTMRNIAQAVTHGSAKFLDRVRQKVQVELLQSYVRNAQGDELRAKYESYVDQQRHAGAPPTIETADFAEFPAFTAYRSDLASLGRQLLDTDGTKLLGQRILKVADDVTDAFEKWARDPANFARLSVYTTQGGKRPTFGTRDDAERAIARSGYKGKAIAWTVKRGDHTIIMSPSEAIARGLWKGDGDKRITFNADFGAELIEKIGRAARRGAKLSVPWQFETAHERLKVLARMGIETPAEFRAALREFIGLREQAAAPDKVKELERSMVGRRNDGMDFFPTPEATADEMVEAAAISVGMTVLEPSAGMGHIAERIREAGAIPDVIELSGDRRELLEAKGFTPVGTDFLDYTPSATPVTVAELESARDIARGEARSMMDGAVAALRSGDAEGAREMARRAGRVTFYTDFHDALRPLLVRMDGGRYDRIVMNPPFSDGRDIQHVRRAYDLLKPGGRLVAIMGESAFTNQNKRATEFRDWLDEIGGTEEKLSEGTFNDPSLPVNTGANARMVVIDKPDSGSPVLSRAQDVTATPEFARWFQESKVTDEDGAPLVVYHGTNKTEGDDAFTSFDVYSSEYGLFGQGGYFTADPEVAAQYTKKGKGSAPTIYPAYLSIQNPIDMDAKADPAAWADAYPQADFQEFEPTSDTNEAYYRAVEEALTFDGVEKYEGAQIMQEGLRGMGFDGITHIGGGRVAADGKRHRVFIAFDPEQIKSAIGNRGTFDPTSAAITLKRGAGAGFTLDQAKTVGQQLEALGVRKIHVVEKVADMPAERRDAILAKDRNGQARGAYFPTEDEVWVVSSNLRNADDMVFVVLHEAFHRGLQVTFGAEGGKLLRQIYATNQKVRELADQNMRRFGIGREEATNEALADLAGKGEAKNLRGWNRLLKMVRAWLAKVGEALGMKLHFTDAMVESLVAGLTRAGLQAQPSVNIAEAATPALSRKPQHTPEQAAAMAKAGMGGPRTLKGKLQRYYSAAISTLHDRHALALETRQGLLDQFAGLQHAVQRDVGNLPTEHDPYIAARLANGGTSSVMRALMLHGQARWAANGQHLEKVDGTKGLLDILAPLGEDLNDWFGWMVGNRAARLMAEGRERNLTKDDIKALQSLATPERATKFKQAAVEYAAFKRSVLDIAEHAGLIDPEGRKVWDYADYIPFYRQIDERSTFSPTGRKGLSGQSSGVRTLRGGEAALNDPMENLLMNFSRLVDASLKNNALRKTIDVLESADSQAVHKIGYDMTSEVLPAEQIRKRLEDAGTPQQVIDVIPPDVFDGMAKMWAIQAPSDPDVVRVMVGGKPNFYRVDDPVLLRSLTSFVPFDFPGLGVMRWFKRLLTSTVTAAPDFVLRNFIRDSLASQMITRDGFNPGKSLKGVVSSMRETGGFEVMLFAGASFQSGNINAADPTGTGRAMRRALRRKGISGASADQFLASVIDSPVKFWEKYRHLSEAVENANREAVFEAATKAGKGPTAAAFEAKDLMDFSLRGSWAAYQLLADVVPFLNARVQGLYRLGRTNKKRLMVVGLTMTAASLLLAYANGGDDDYEALPDWDKDTYWHFWLFGQHFRVPKPFELGVAFATIPERVMRYAVGQDSGNKLGGRVWANVRDQLAFDPVPQMIRPVLNVWANKDTFRDSPIETQRDDNLPPHLRYGAGTSPTVRETLDKTAPLTDPLGISPKRLEYLVNAYTGAAGMYALALGDAAVRRILDEAPQPSMRWDDVPVVKAFYRVDPARSTVWESDLYSMREAADAIHAGVEALKKDGRLDKAQDLEEANLAKLRARKVLDDAGQRLRLLRKRSDVIYGSRTMSKDEKRAQLDEVARLRAEVARKAVEHPTVKEAF